MTTINDVNKDVQSRFETTSSSYVSFEYNSKFNGIVTMETTVDMAVIVTERARSALKMEHHLRDIVYDRNRNK